MVVHEDFIIPMGHQDEFISGNLAASSYSSGKRRKNSSHRYKTLRAKVKDVIGASSDFASPNSVAAGTSLEKTAFSSQPREDTEHLDVIFEDRSQSSPEQEGLRDFKHNIRESDELQEQEDLTDPAEWRKFIDSVKREVAGGHSPLPTSPRVAETREDVREVFRSSRSRTPISLRRLFPFGKADKRGDDDVDLRQTPQRSRSPARRSRSPIKRSLSPTKFRRRSDPPSIDRSELIESNSSGNMKSRGIRIPRFPSPGRRSPYTQMPYTNNELVNNARIEESGNEAPFTIIPDVPQELSKSDVPSEPNSAVVTNSQSPSQDTTKVSQDDNMMQQNARRSRRKSPRLPQAAKPLPPEIQELNNQVREAVGSGIHEDDDTSGGIIHTNDGSTTDVASDNADDLLSNINISTTSGIQVKREKEKEEMVHQTIARRVLSVLIRPKSPQGNETRTAEIETVTSTSGGRAISPPEDEYTDAPDATFTDSIGTGDATNSSTQSKIREQLKILKAKKAHISLKKKAEKSRRKLEKSKKQKKSKSRNATVKNDKHLEEVETSTSYESFDSFTSNAGGNCFTSTFCCCFDSKNTELETDAETAGISSDTSLDTYESEWLGRPLPILSPSDLSAENDDVFDILEKCVCGAT